jgi:DNA transformation protein
MSMDREFLIDLFAGFGPVMIRPMFSGFGISANGINFALALRSGLYLRADEQTFPDFEAAGSKPFQYETRARTITVGSYWQAPAHLFDDADAFAQWARAALAAAQRAALKKRARARKPAREAAANKSAGTRSADKKPKQAQCGGARNKKAASKELKAKKAATKPARSRKSGKSAAKVR